jgi:hypothetical protein
MWFRADKTLERRSGRNKRQRDAAAGQTGRRAVEASESPKKPQEAPRLLRLHSNVSDNYLQEAPVIELNTAPSSIATPPSVIGTPTVTSPVQLLLLGALKKM